MAHCESKISVRSSIPAAVGIGLRSVHYQEILAKQPEIAWFEVHSENYFAKGGAPLYYLERIRADYPISLHGVAASLGSADPLDMQHLALLKALIARIEPDRVSEHLAWNSFAGEFLNDLAPLPYTDETLHYLCDRVQQVQDYLGRQILIENPSSYLEFECSTWPESRFLAELAVRSGCGILLDVNNVFVSCCNHGWSAMAYLQDMPAERVQEIHLGGHTRNRWKGGEILIDTHDQPVCHEVWTLYQTALRWLGPKSTLIEWDNNIPALATLMAEADTAGSCLEACYARVA